jgi:hypothetical protein
LYPKKIKKINKTFIFKKYCFISTRNYVKTFFFKNFNRFVSLSQFCFYFPESFVGEENYNITHNTYIFMLLTVRAREGIIICWRMNEGRAVITVRRFHYCRRCSVHAFRQWPRKVRFCPNEKLRKGFPNPCWGANTSIASSHL